MLANAGADIFRANSIGPLSKCVDNHIFFQILAAYIQKYNQQRRLWNKEIQENGGRIQEGSRIWYQGKIMPDGLYEEFDEDMQASVSFLWIESR